MSPFILNTLLADYVSATFFNDVSPALFDQITEGLRSIAPDATVREHVTRLQYVGRLRADQAGSAYLGTGRQVGRPHSLLQVSGTMANAAWNDLVRDLALRGLVTLTRLDLQVTIPKPNDIDLHGCYRLATALHRTVSIVTSTSADEAELSTLYIGARVSDVFWRIYEKLGALGNTVLRAEVELKGDAARQLPRYLAEGGDLGSVYAQKLRKLQLKAITQHFMAGLRCKDRYVIIRNEGNTGRWLRETVLPALTGYLQQAEDSDEVATLFEEVLGRYWEYRLQA